MTIPPDGASPAPGIGFEPEKRNTALQCHVAFFDRDRDGVIWPSDTFHGFRTLGFSLFLSALAVLVIHTGFSYPTYGTLLPDPFFRLKINNMHRAKHGSDTESYTAVGEFDEKRFEHVFKMYSSPPHTHLSFTEGLRMLYGSRNLYDPFGWFAAMFEWLATYIMLWPMDGRMKKEEIKAIYDGSMFYKVASARKATRDFYPRR
ncbi:hypothetical protein AMATHDRAFT_72925 [Amanita thiersii Skay4041]|uniref:Caleosin n=1 Tax=Amanita thiersii Skay4041 TaxID=703135 RepID=A0A2A9NZC0_9AGAR|nr:hypothetical protein AMATHDRAFT_72925 [Amanita thiersii Skay4041]